MLDPAQNHSFRDHYLEIPVDLSKILFIATANQLGTVHPALLDRMEIIQLAGYSEEEKVHIARKYLLPRQMTEHGLPDDTMQIPDETLRLVISEGTARGWRPKPRTPTGDAGAKGRGADSLYARSTARCRRQRSSTQRISNLFSTARFRKEMAFRTSSNT